MTTKDTADQAPGLPQGAQGLLFDDDLVNLDDTAVG